MRKCRWCHKEFEPEKENYTICPDCWVPVRQKCEAIRLDGLPCTRWARYGGRWCIQHEVWRSSEEERRRFALGEPLPPIE